MVPVCHTSLYDRPARLPLFFPFLFFSSLPLFCPLVLLVSPTRLSSRAEEPRAITRYRPPLPLLLRPLCPPPLLVVLPQHTWMHTSAPLFPPAALPRPRWMAPSLELRLRPPTFRRPLPVVGFSWGVRRRALSSRISQRCGWGANKAKGPVRCRPVRARRAGHLCLCLCRDCC